MFPVYLYSQNFVCKVTKNINTNKINQDLFLLLASGDNDEEDCCLG